MYGLLAIKVACAMSSPCAPVVSLSVRIVCQPAADANVGSDDLGITATVEVGCAVAVSVGGTIVGVSVGATVDAAPESVVCCLTGVTPHAASSVLANSSRLATSRSERRDETRVGDVFRNKSRILPVDSATLKQPAPLLTLEASCFIRLEQDSGRYFQRTSRFPPHAGPLASCRALYATHILSYWKYTELRGRA